MKELKEFTVEQLERLIHLAGAGCAVYESNTVAALAKIALAAKQAKPVAWITQPAFEDNNGTAFVFMSEANLSGSIPFYTTPPLNHNEQHMVVPDGWVEFVANIADDSHMNNSLREWANRLLAAAPKPDNE